MGDDAAASGQTGGGPVGPPPETASPETASTDRLKSILGWALGAAWLPAAQWRAVADLLTIADTGLDLGDLTTVLRAQRELERIELAAASRLGDEPDPDRYPIPPPVRQLANRLVHRLGEPGDERGAADGDDESPAPALVRAAGPATDPAPGGASRGGRRFLALPVFDRTRIAFAETEGEREQLTDAVELAGMRVTRHAGGRDSVHLLVSPGETGTVGDVVEVSVDSAPRGQRLFLPLWHDLNGHAVASIEIFSRAPRLELSIVPPFSAAALDEGDAPAVRGSVSLTTRSGRNAWRAIARARPDGDPIREAVIDALR